MWPRFRWFEEQQLHWGQQRKTKCLREKVINPAKIWKPGTKTDVEADMLVSSWFHGTGLFPGNMGILCKVGVSRNGFWLKNRCLNMHYFKEGAAEQGIQKDFNERLMCHVRYGQHPAERVEELTVWASVFFMEGLLVPEGNKTTGGWGHKNWQR